MSFLVFQASCGERDSVFAHSIVDFIGLPNFIGFPSGLKSHLLISHGYLSQNEIASVTTKPSSHVLEVCIKIGSGKLQGAT